MPNALEYAQREADRFLSELEELTCIRSISTDPHYAGEVERAAQWLAADMRRIGLDAVGVSPTEGHPVVYGEWMGAGSAAPTVLLYAHYDVQPAERDEGWDSDPFTPTRRDGKIIARGIGDDKLHAVMILKVAESYLCSDQACPVNLKLVIEGEEEMGSRNFMPWIRANRERLGADCALVCDGGIHAPEEPTIVYALRGLVALELTVRGPRADLHSGLYGGQVHNPAQVLAEMVAQLHDSSGRVAVPGFYERVVELTGKEREELNKEVVTAEDFRREVGAPAPWGEEGYSLVERAGARPTLEINGISGGYTGTGMKTVIPAEASAKITCRLVSNQDPERIFEQIRSYLEAMKPPTVEIEVTNHGGASPVLVPLDSAPVRALVRAFSYEWQTPPLFRRRGSTIPVAQVFYSDLGLPTLPMGFNVDNAGFHGPNEFIHIDLFHRGLRTMIHLLREITAE